ncbi:hypothetical protein NB716_002331 [Pantoea ananatis]|nr:hypothetical protein [Pantoea ananatis]
MLSNSIYVDQPQSDQSIHCNQYTLQIPLRRSVIRIRPRIIMGGLTDDRGFTVVSKTFTVVSKRSKGIRLAANGTCPRQMECSL